MAIASNRLKAAAGLLAAALLAACSGTEQQGGPGGPMLADGTCAQLRADLNSMDKRGVPGMIDARNNGKKYGPQQDAEISRYNQVLDQYLGGQCASEQRYKSRGAPQAAAPSRSASITTGSVGSVKSQVRRKKPVDGDDVAAAPAENADAAAKPPVRKAKATGTTAATKAAATAGDAAAAPAPAPKTEAAPAPKTDSGLPPAPKYE